MNENIITLLIGLIAGITAMWFYCRYAMVSKALFASLETKSGYDEQKISEVTSERDALKSYIDTQRQSITDKDILIAELNVRIETTNSSMDQHKLDIQNMHEQFKEQFTNISGNILSKQTAIFGEKSAKDITALLEPFKTEIKAIHDSIHNDSKSRASLEGEIKNIVKTHSAMAVETQNLTKALKGDSKVQGSWGEISLEKILENSGLRKNEDYVIQTQGMALRDSEGKLARPDVIVNLPEKKHIIIDAKVSLTSYERYQSEEDEQTKGIHLSSFVSSVKEHIRELGEKRYQDLEQICSPEFVLMFMPIEGAYILAMQKYPELHSFAWDKKIVIVCPSILYTTLRTVHSVWRLEKQNQNALKIANRGGALYNKVEGFVNDLKVVGMKINDASKAHDSAMDKLSRGRGNILSQVEDLKNLGIKTSKSLPVELLEIDTVEELEEV